MANNTIVLSHPLVHVRSGKQPVGQGGSTVVGGADGNSLFLIIDGVVEVDPLVFPDLESEGEKSSVPIEVSFKVGPVVDGVPTLILADPGDWVLVRRLAPGSAGKVKPEEKAQTEEVVEDPVTEEPEDFTSEKGM